MSILIPIIAGVVVFAGLFMFLGPRLLDKEGNLRTKQLIKGLNEIKENSELSAQMARNVRVFKAEEAEKSILIKLLEKLPLLSDVPSLLNKSGARLNLATYFLSSFAVMAAIISFTTYSGFGILGIAAAIFGGFYIPKKVAMHFIEKRTEEFINSFPDALDMIVRSVRSGQPLNSALKMITENMQPPISTEFKQVVDEISYGRSITEALYRLSERIDQTDIAFFVVVLAVQQETGGNLAEVLSNFSTVIRKRKQLRLKIKALTSEGRMTAWILGSLPGILVIVLQFFAPGYLDPLFHDPTGKKILGIVGMLVVGSVIMIRKLIRIEI